MRGVHRSGPIGDSPSLACYSMSTTALRSGGHTGEMLCISNKNGVLKSGPISTPDVGSVRRYLPLGHGVPYLAGTTYRNAAICSLSPCNLKYLQKAASKQATTRYIRSSDSASHATLLVDNGLRGSIGRRDASLKDSTTRYPRSNTPRSFHTHSYPF